MVCREASSAWLCACSPFAAVRSFKLRRPSISFCINGPSHSTCSSSSPPNITRHWIVAESSSSRSSQERFMVVSYNILADKNASKHRDMYQNIDSTDMKWHRRKRLICEELLGWNPDIICLQEVDKYYDLLSEMEKAGYDGSYKRRTGDNMVDGCAMFWKAEKFRLLEGESIEFREYGLKDNVAQLSVLEMCTKASRRIVVGNIHVLYYPTRGDVKVGQIRSLLSKAHILSEKWGNIPIVLGGDYNSTPQSPIYKFLSSSELNIGLYDRRELSGQRDCHPAQVFGIKEKGGSLSPSMDSFFKKSSWTKDEIKAATGSAENVVALHPLKLRSSYSMLVGSARTRNSIREPLATSYHSKFFGTVDYLWYSNGLEPIRVLDTLTFDNLKNTGGLPYMNMGSDHLALVSEFAFVPTTEYNMVKGRNLSRLYALKLMSVFFKVQACTQVPEIEKIQ